jgi:hypothetical protein
VAAKTKRAKATRHVVEGQRIIAHQRALIADKLEKGLDATQSEELLAQFEQSLAIFEADLRSIETAGKP